MLPSDYIRPVNHDLKTALWAYLALLFIAASISGCVSFQKPSGPKRKWQAPIYHYNPDVAGKCHVTNYNTENTIDCDEPKMYEMFCAPLDELPKLETDVINQCSVWK